MVVLKWTDDMSLNIREIDDQHKKLIDMLNDFYNEMLADNKAAFAKLLKAISDYTVFHFKTEEKYFARFNYAESEEHIRQHNDFVAKINDLRERFNSGKLVLSFELTNFLKDWLVKHIKVEDKKYRNLFVQNGVS